MRREILTIPASSVRRTLVLPGGGNVIRIEDPAMLVKLGRVLYVFGTGIADEASVYSRWGYVPVVYATDAQALAAWLRGAGLPVPAELRDLIARLGWAEERALVVEAKALA